MDIRTVLETARAQQKTIVLPEGLDERILRAARRLVDEGIATPILLGEQNAIETLAKSHNIALDGVTSINPKTAEQRDSYAQLLASTREKITESAAERQLRKELVYGGMMVASGDADALIAGVSNPTSRVITAGLLTIGMAKGIRKVSSYFLMILPEFAGVKNKPLIFADCGVNVEPNADELADIAIASAASAENLLGEQARVAMLSFSTLGSGKHAVSDKVVEATAIVRSRAPAILVEGELQLDAALVPDVASRKVIGDNPVAGQANVLVFPDLNSGNIAYKLTQYLAGARAYGPLLQGFAKPISDLSRGASVDDIVETAAILLATAE